MVFIHDFFLLWRLRALFNDAFLKITAVLMTTDSTLWAVVTKFGCN